VGEQGHAAIMIKFSHEGPQSGDVPGHLPCPVGMAIRPGLPGRSVLDPVVEKKRLSQWAASITTDASGNGIWRSYAESSPASSRRRGEVLRWMAAANANTYLRNRKSTI
jgi:hypothetical protein